MLTTATLILCLAALGQVFTLPTKRVKILPLDMAEDSVDDQYEGCKEKMAELLVKPLHEASETQGMYPRGFTWNHLFAISAYTGESIYKQFRADTVNGKDNYKEKTYRWYSLYFLLTDAIQILNKQQKEEHPGCITTYRGTSLRFNTSVLNENIRFGQFASSSTNRNETNDFGNVSCFEIRTCEGAHVSKYSLYPTEEEVLIPPYEVFKVTNVTFGGWCETVFHLNSTGTQSNLNCALVDVRDLWQSIKDFFKRLVGKG